MRGAWPVIGAAAAIDSSIAVAPIYFSSACSATKEQSR